MSKYAPQAPLPLFDLAAPRPKPKPGTQCARILLHMQEHGSITQREAIGLGCYRLAARILDLKEGYGVEIETTMLPHDGGTHARYRLV